MTNRKGKRSKVSKEWSFMQMLAALSLLCASGAIIYFGYVMAYRMIYSFIAPGYITYLTVVVTILMAAGALFGGGNIWISLRTRTIIERERRNLEQLRDEASRLMNDFRSYSSAYATFRPLGLNLAVAIRNLEGQVEDCDLKKFIRSLGRQVEANAMLGAQLSRLFLSTEPKEVKSAALALAGHEGVSLKRLIQGRLDLEKEKFNPDSRLIEYLSKILGMLS